jgi:DMSO/TMAO reductase YedYZ molybdopterin-dependent catalytic subunit
MAARNDSHAWSTVEQRTNPMPRLPPGQYELDRLPRFGLTRFADRFPQVTDRIELSITGEVEQPIEIGAALARLPRFDQSSEFHCVTTWSNRELRWSGWRFKDVLNSIILPQAILRQGATFVVMRGQDGARASLPLDDLLADDVLLADRLNGAALPLANGAPLRLVAPAHYGYKSVKHLCRIEFYFDNREYRPSGYRFMEHPRARVALEERGRGVPGLLLRYCYRMLVGPTIRHFERADREQRRQNQEQRHNN